MGLQLENELDGIFFFEYHTAMSKPTFFFDRAEEAAFTARDAQDLAGITYRQLNDWDQKGILGANRKGDEGWRKFTPRQMFALVVCAKLRRTFGIPLESLRWVTEVMLREGADHFRWAVHTIVKYQWTIFLMTDFGSTFIFDCDHNFQSIIDTGYFRRREEQSYVFVHINPLVNAVLRAAGGGDLETSEEFYQKLREYEKKRLEFHGESIDEREREILRLLREKNDQRVTVVVRNGEIVRADVDDKVSVTAGECVADQIGGAIDDEDYATLRVVKKAGRVVGMERHIPVKLDEMQGEPDSASIDPMNVLVIRSGKDPRSGRRSANARKESEHAPTRRVPEASGT